MMNKIELLNRLMNEGSPKELVDEHSGEERNQDPDDREAEQGPQASVKGAVNHFAVGSVGENVSTHSCNEPNKQHCERPLTRSWLNRSQLSSGHLAQAQR